MGLGTGIPVETGFDNYSNKPLDPKYGPYADVVSANAAIDQNYRHIGLTIGIDDGSGAVEYWYKSGVLDTDLILKESSPAPVSSLKEIEEYIYSPSNDDDTEIDISTIFQAPGTILNVFFNGSLLVNSVDYNINTVNETLEWLDVDVTLRTWHIFQIKFRPD